MKNWYCVHTRPQQKARARQHVQRQGFKSCLPILRCNVTRSGRWRSVVEPLLPLHQSLRADIEAISLVPVRSTRGPVGLVRAAGQPAPVLDELLGVLRFETNADSLSELTERRLLSGDCIVMTDGPLKCSQGIFGQAQGQYRALVLPERLGSGQGVAVPKKSAGTDRASQRCLRQRTAHWEPA